MQTNASIVATLLREYGEAVRGDWAIMDGRMVQADAHILADALGAPAPPDPGVLRYVLELCPAGGGHWTEHCSGACRLSCK